MVFLFDQRRPLPGSIVLSVTLMSVVLLAVACSGGNEPGESTSNAEPTAVATEAADDTGEATPAPADDQPSASETQPSSEDEPEAVVQRQILFFHTEWWPTCNRIRPVWAELVQEYGDAAELIEYDREKEPGRELARMYGIFYQPVFIVLDADGELIEQRAGINTGESLRTFIEEHVAAQ